MAEENVIIVSSSAELSAALENATGGETIKLAAGDYGDVSFSNLAYSSQVTVTSLDPNDDASFRSIKLNTVENLTFDDIDVNFTQVSDSKLWSNAIEIRNSSNVEVTNSDIEGALGDSGSGGPSDIIEGYAFGRGFAIYDSDDISVTNNEVSQFQHALVINGNDGLTINNNELHDMRTSPIVGSDNRNILIDGNDIHSSQPWNFGGDGDHGDFIHLWISKDQEEASPNITITNNYLHQGTGTSILGIYLDNNGQMDGVQFENVLISNNVISLGNKQAIRVEGVQGLEISNNTLIQSDGDSKDGPTVFLAYGVEDAVIKDNILSRPVSESGGAEYNKNILESNNLIVQIHDPDGENYVGDLFVNAMIENPSLDDLAALLDTVIDQMGVGSSLTSADLVAGSGNDQPTDDGSGDEPPADDGSGDEPPADDGSGDEPPADDGSGDEPPADDDDPANDNDDGPVLGDPLTEAQEHARLQASADVHGDDMINLGRGEEYFDFNDFTASVTFSMDSLDGGRQKLLWNHTNYGIQVKNDDLYVYFNEEGGEKEFFAFKNVIKDTSWHDVQIVLDDDANTFSVYFDGNLLEMKEDVTGGVGDASWWDVTVGAYGKNARDDFQGDIADFTVLDHAIEIDSSQSVYERTAAIDSLDNVNDSQAQLIGVANYGQEILDFS